MGSEHKGFASMQDKQRHREIARAGGKAAHALGTAHTWTSEEAAAAGRKGAEARRRKRLVEREAAGE